MSNGKWEFKGGRLVNEKLNVSLTYHQLYCIIPCMPELRRIAEKKLKGYYDRPLPKELAREKRILTEIERDLENENC